MMNKIDMLFNVIQKKASGEGGRKADVLILSSLSPDELKSKNIRLLTGISDINFRAKEKD